MIWHGHILAAISGFVIIWAVLRDAFETVVLPRRVTRHFQITAWFYRQTWIPWRRIAEHIKTAARQQNFLGYFGPLSLFLLLGFWATGLISGFALVQYGIGGHEQLSGEPMTFGRILYHSGETFFTLGYGDIVPTSGAARALSVIEAGMGFAFLGVVIGYIPVVYSSFSRREIQISMLDARAGSPPTAEELLVRLARTQGNSGMDQRVLDQVLRDWERWAAELLESQISYPALTFFRSQHSNQSWLGALTTMLDVTSLLMVGIEGVQPEQAKLTFAMARHAAVDLAQVVKARYETAAVDRLPAAELDRLQGSLAAAGLRLRNDEAAREKLAKLRLMYEPYLHAMSRNLMLPLPPWRYAAKPRDNWQAGPWDRLIQARGLAVLGQNRPRLRGEDHF
ncbi:Ion transport 2 domain protein [Candidatus Sulfotelmatobacter kueseliae]|uniref:Ion transport 2 domain protein n=1 Tax=Candidatus Sulfotelmatobacter kueseliae TaxID=2042962 RepID=A0A2U3KRP1_9BACT|nr:Ion transport 2 domain protein [Candidatus Sulfotelmatobacter kueseliae]